MTRDQLMAFAQRVRRIWGWFPISPAGALLLLGLYAALFYFGAEKEDHLLAVLGLGGLLLAFICLVFSAGSAALLYWKLKKIPPLEGALLVEQQLRLSPFKLPLPWWIPLVRVEWREKRRGKHHRTNALKIFTEGESEQILPLRRGEWEVIERHFDVVGLMGLFRISFTHAQPCELQVLPSMGNFREPITIQALLSGSDWSHPLGAPVGDRIDQRSYVQGDPIRQILWKIYARTGELIVRTPERALQPSPKLLAYLVVSEGDGAAAGILWAALEHRLLGAEWRLGADGQPEGVDEFEAARNLIISSAEASVRDGEDLGAFVNAAQSKYGTAQELLIFAPPTRGAWLQNVAHLNLGRGCTVVICIDGFEAQLGWKRWVYQPSETLFMSRAGADFLDICSELQGCGVTVLIADRQNGALVPAEQLQRMAS